MWIAYRAGHSRDGNEPIGDVLPLLYAFSIAALYLCFMCIRTATRQTENVVTPALLLASLHKSKAAPTDPLLLASAKRIALIRLIIMACFCGVALCTILATRHFAGGAEYAWTYYANTFIGVIAAAQVASSRLKGV